jgi:DNA polymerase III sliding clamp (beta) subunit (PCNA family)
LFSDESFNFDKLITMEFSNDKIRLTSKDAQGNVSKSFPCSLDGLEENFSIMVNPVFLLEVLGKIQAEHKGLKVGTDRVLFDFDYFRHLMVAFGEE